MKTVYVIDACALINAAQNYNMAKKSFAHIWEALDEMIQRGAVSYTHLTLPTIGFV